MNVKRSQSFVDCVSGVAIVTHTIEETKGERLSVSKRESAGPGPCTNVQNSTIKRS